MYQKGNSGPKDLLEGGKLKLCPWKEDMRENWATDEGLHFLRGPDKKRIKERKSNDRRGKPLSAGSSGGTFP